MADSIQQEQVKHRPIQTTYSTRPRSTSNTDQREMIPYTETTKILGVTFDNNLNFKRHTDYSWQNTQNTDYKDSKY